MLRIPLATHVALRWHARADRRAGLPLGMGAVTTPMLQTLTARHGDACERERARFLDQTQAVVVRLGRLRAQMPALRATLADRAADLARVSVPLTQHQLTRRLAGEQDLPEALIRQRRQTTHDRSLEAARTAWRAAAEALDASLAEQAQLLAGRREQAEVTCSRVLRYGDFIRAQAAVYRRALVRRHPDREALVHEWQVDLCPTPAWAEPAVLLSSSEAGVPA